MILDSYWKDVDTENLKYPSLMSVCVVMSVHEDAKPPTIPM